MIRNPLRYLTIQGLLNVSVEKSQKGWIVLAIYKERHMLAVFLNTAAEVNELLGT